MSGVTEYAVFPVKPGVDVSNESSAESRILQDGLKLVLSQPGAQRAYYGPEIENPGNVRLFVDWDKVEDHIAFTKSDAYGPMMKSLAPLFEPGSSYIKHAALKPFPPNKLLDSMVTPVTEVMSGHFPADISPADKEAVSKLVETFVEKSLKTSPDFRGISWGWSLENDVPVPGKDGEKGAALVALIGWPSVEAHMKYRETPEFKDHIGAIRGAKDLITLHAYHVSPTVLTA